MDGKAASESEGHAIFRLTGEKYIDGVVALHLLSVDPARRHPLFGHGRCQL